MTTNEQHIYTLPLYDEDTRRVRERVPVSEPVYRAYWQETEHARYLDRQAKRRELSWQAQAEVTDEASLDYLCAQRLATPETAEGQATLHEAMADALAVEDAALVEALWQLALGETTQQAVAERWGVTPGAVSRRVKRAHARLRARIMERMGEDVKILRKIS